jgi:hypothetical protein
MDEIYNRIIALIKRLEDAVRMQDVPAIIDCMKDLAVDNRQRSILEKYTRQICIDVITDHITRKKLDKFVVSRKGEYSTTVKDIYVLDGDVLKRNGTDVKWSTLGKLYQAYKKINKIK